MLTIMIDWNEAVEDYKTHYEDTGHSDEYIVEYIDALVPIYYGDIVQTFMSLNGPSMTFRIEGDDVGRPVYNLMQRIIFDEYMGEFMAHWTGFDEED